MAATNEESFIQSFISEKSSESLEVPLGFNKYLPDPLPNTVELLDSSGRSWTVRMKKRGEKVFLTIGWENFVKENNLEDGKMMEFIYDCNRTFHVIIFGHGGVSEFRDFPQVVIDADEYETGEEEDEEEDENFSNYNLGLYHPRKGEAKAALS